MRQIVWIFRNAVRLTHIVNSRRVHQLTSFLN